MKTVYIYCFSDIKLTCLVCLKTGLMVDECCTVNNDRTIMADNCGQKRLGAGYHTHVISYVRRSILKFIQLLPKSNILVVYRRSHQPHRLSAACATINQDY